ncbi:hypothetical protein [Maribacter sp. ACAM166]|uniref:hypothetical protein n=1 Tax=Maribacter sp. ACAM166 TaxID=2508996 RepID=UPI0010FE2A98|nr:hypothetical protein [Maribacter sp. ACAM166]TLP76961.1 hypothetical protein ES765_13795 [Maribacter sp. ACAM166]
MKFEESVKIAFVKMIYDVIKADGKVHPGELIVLDNMKKGIGFDDAFLNQAKELDYDDAIVTLYNMPYEQKKALAKILDEVAMSDGSVHKKEMTLIIDTFINIGIGEESE